MTTNTLQLCPGGCNEHLDPDYITNTVIIEGDPVKVCDQCFDDFEECDTCHKYHHRDNVNTVYISHEHGFITTCDDCAERAHNAYEAEMEHKFEEMRLEGRRYW